MTNQKNIVALDLSEVQQLKDIIGRGKHSARVITRARVLLMANENNGGLDKKDKEIWEALNIARITVQRIRKRYVEGKLERALFDAPRPGGEKRLNVKEEAQLVSLACTKAPPGYSYWTLDLLEEEINKKLKDKNKQVGRTTVWRIMLKNKLKPWREKNVVHKHN